MKTSFITSRLTAALVILTLTATTVVQAQNISDVEREITEGKLAAAGANQDVSGNPLIQVVRMKMELDSIATKIDDLQNEVGTSVDDSNGVIKSLADKALSLEVLKAEFLETDKEIQKERGYGLALRIDEAGKIVKKARIILNEAHTEVEKAK